MCHNAFENTDGCNNTTISLFIGGRWLWYNIRSARLTVVIIVDNISTYVKPLYTAYYPSLPV